MSSTFGLSMRACRPGLGFPVSLAQRKQQSTSFVNREVLEDVGTSLLPTQATRGSPSALRTPNPGIHVRPTSSPSGSLLVPPSPAISRCSGRPPPAPPGESPGVPGDSPGASGNFPLRENRREENRGRGRNGPGVPAAREDEALLPPHPRMRDGAAAPLLRWRSQSSASRRWGTDKQSLFLSAHLY